LPLEHFPMSLIALIALFTRGVTTRRKRSALVSVIPLPSSGSFFLRPILSSCGFAARRRLVSGCPAALTHTFLQRGLKNLVTDHGNAFIAHPDRIPTAQGIDAALIVQGVDGLLVEGQFQMVGHFMPGATNGDESLVGAIYGVRCHGIAPL